VRVYTGSASQVGRFRRAQSGSVAIQFAILLTALIGMSALGGEMTFAIYKHRQQQSAADTAALGAATALSVGYPADPAVEARAIAASAGFVDGAASTTVAVNNPPASGPNAGNKLAVEVIVMQQQTLAMVGLFLNAPITITARAVAVNGGSPYCILALDNWAAGAISIRNNSAVSNPLCGIAANSADSRALILNNNATVAGPVSVHGDWSLASGATLSGHPLIKSGPIIADPYAGVQLQNIPSCTGQSLSGDNGRIFSLTAGHFCNGWNFGNNVTVNLASGTYYIDQQLTTGNYFTLSGTSGVTLVINGNYSVSFGNGSSINVTAPSSGTYAGLAFFGLRNATSTVTQTFSNQITMNIKGAVYFPNQIVEFDNNGSTTSGGCTQVIGRVVDIQNNVELDNNCSGTGVASIGSSPGQLTE